MNFSGPSSAPSPILSFLDITNPRDLIHSSESEASSSPSPSSTSGTMSGEASPRISGDSSSSELWNSTSTPPNHDVRVSAPIRHETTTIEIITPPSTNNEHEHPQRLNRMPSLYMPIDDGTLYKPNGSTWPFDRRASELYANPPMSPTAMPYSPSLINPAFAFPPSPSTGGPPQFQSLMQAANEKPLGLSEAGLRKVGIYRPSSDLSWAERMDLKFNTPTAWLILYFAFNLGLTLYNKFVLQGFPFAWTLTGVQMLSGSIGSRIALSRGYFTPATLTTKENLTMLAFSFLYTINIAVSNLSLHLVTVPVSSCFPSNSAYKFLWIAHPDPVFSFFQSSIKSFAA